MVFVDEAPDLARPGVEVVELLDRELAQGLEQEATAGTDDGSTTGAADSGEKPPPEMKPKYGAPASAEVEEVGFASASSPGRATRRWGHGSAADILDWGMDDQPNRSAIRALSKHEIKRLQQRRLLDLHDGVTKFGGSRQDVFMDKDTGELWVARKYSPSYFERLHLNPREMGIPGF